MVVTYTVKILTSAGIEVTIGTDWSLEDVERIRHWLLGTTTDAAQALQNVDWLSVSTPSGNEYHVARQHIISIETAETVAD